MSRITPHVHLLFHFYLELKAIIQNADPNAARREMPNQLAKNKRGNHKMTTTTCYESKIMAQMRRCDDAKSDKHSKPKKQSLHATTTHTRIQATTTTTTPPLSV